MVVLVTLNMRYTQVNEVMESKKHMKNLIKLSFLAVGVSNTFFTLKKKIKMLITKRLDMEIATTKITMEYFLSLLASLITSDTSWGVTG